MPEFKLDFLFSDKIKAALEKRISAYKSQKALKDMKHFDKLGTIEAPVRLLFVKYLIDTNDHKSIYNLINVLGDNFYVINDYSKLNNPIRIRLINDKSSQYKWQVILLGEKT